MAAESEAIAEAALDLIDVEYEELPVVTDAIEAMATGCAAVHPNVAAYKGLLHKIDTPSNVFVHLTWKKGVVEEGFRQSDVVVENTFTRARSAPSLYRAAFFSGARQCRRHGGCLVVEQKSRSICAMQVGNAMQVAPASLIIHPCYVGGDFGGKGDGNDVALCYALANRPAGRSNW